jgi:putative membrane protein
VIVAAAWQDDLPLAGVLVALGLYLLGSRGRPALVPRTRSARRHRRAAAFLAGLAVIVLALQPPLDELAGRDLWAHMVQHLLLMVVAAPLLVLAGPWLRLWRGLPVSWRRPVARALLGWARTAPIRAAAAWIGAPVPAWTLFNLDLVAWHLPWAYDLAVQVPVVHDLEHASFLGLGILYWAQVIDSPPFRTRLDNDLRRVAYLVSGMIPSWGLAVVLAFSAVPVYAAYAKGHPGLSALADQQIAAGIMWVPGSVPASLAIFWHLYRWLAADADGEGTAAGQGRRRHLEGGT